MSSNKQRAAAAAAELITDGMVLGRGEFGAESEWAEQLGRRAAARGADALWSDITERQSANRTLGLARVWDLGLLSSVGQHRNHPCRIHLRTRKTAQLTRAGVEWESWI